MLLRNRLTAHDKRIIGTMRQTYSLDGKKRIGITRISFLSGIALLGNSMAA
jgi:hypothetical protein